MGCTAVHHARAAGRDAREVATHRAPQILCAGVFSFRRKGATGALLFFPYQRPAKPAAHAARRAQTRAKLQQPQPGKTVPEIRFGEVLPHPRAVARSDREKVENLQSEERRAGMALRQRYLPFHWSTRMRTGSSNAESPLRVPTLVPATSFHLTGTSIAVYPSRRAINSTSTSKPNRSSCCRRKISRAARVSNNLKPHCVSRYGRPAIMRTPKLNTLPADSRKAGWCTPISERSSAREPIATWALAFCAAVQSLSSSSMGAERSASVNSAHSPLASSIPWRTE